MSVVVQRVQIRIDLPNGKRSYSGLFFDDPNWTAVELTNAAAAATGVMQDATRRALFSTGCNIPPCTAQAFTTVPPGGLYPNGRLQPVSIEYAPGSTLAGLAVGDMAGPGTSVVCSMKSALPGKRFRGRLYLPTTLEANVDGGGLISSAAQTQWLTMVQDVLAAVIPTFSVGTSHVVVSRKGEVATPITVLSIDDWLKSQRRRNRRG